MVSSMAMRMEIRISASSNTKIKTGNQVKGFDKTNPVPFSPTVSAPSRHTPRKNPYRNGKAAGIAPRQDPIFTQTATARTAQKASTKKLGFKNITFIMEENPISTFWKSENSAYSGNQDAVSNRVRLSLPGQVSAKISMPTQTATHPI